MTIRPNWLFLSIVALVIASPFLFVIAPGDHRTLSAALGYIAFIGLAYQLGHWWSETPTSTRIAVFLILASLLGGAIAQTQIAQRPGDMAVTVAFYPLIAQRVACIAFALFLRRVVLMDTASPWIKRSGPVFRS